MASDRTNPTMTLLMSQIDQRKRVLLYMAASGTFLFLLVVFLLVLHMSVGVELFLLVPLVCFWCLPLLLFSPELRARPTFAVPARRAASNATRAIHGCSFAERQFVPALLLTPVWTLALLKPIVFQFCSLVADFRIKRVLRRGKVASFSSWARRFLFLYCMVYAFSLLINVRNAGGTGPIFGGIYNLSIWIMGFLLLVVLAKAGTLEGLERWLRGLVYFGILASSFACIGLLAWMSGVLTLQVVSPLLAILPKAVQHSNLRSAAWISFVYPGWFFAREPRSASIVNYGTQLGFIVVATILATIHVARKRRWSFFRLSLFLGPQLVALVLSQGRTAVVALFLAAIHTLFYVNRRKTLLLLVASLAVGAATLLLAPREIPQLWKSFSFEARRGSENDRFAIYAADIAIWRKNPLLGFGYKAHNELDLVHASLGSESTYLGVLVKTGLLGLAPFLAFLLALYTEWYSLGKRIASRITRDHWLYLGATLVVFVTAMLTEDLDATQVFPFIFFITAGYTLALARLTKQAPIRS